MKTDFNKVVSFIETTLPKTIIILTPLFASSIPAIFLFKNLAGPMQMSIWQALIIALATEGIGISSITVYQSAVQFNKRYKDKKNHVSLRAPIIAYVIYLSSIIFANGLLEIQFGLDLQIIKSITAILLSLLSLSGALLLSTNQAIQFVENKNKRKATGKTGKTTGKTGNQTETKRKTTGKQPANFPIFQITNKTDLTDEMITHIKNGHSPDTLKKMFPNVTPRTIRNWKQEIGS